jgi:hypothetical protein
VEKEISISQFIRVINDLPYDKQIVDVRIWYTTQKQHWLGWLDGYYGPGAYGRKNWKNRDAKFVYNHVVCPGLLLYLIRAIPLQPELIEAAEKASETYPSLMAKAGAIRKVVPWSEIYRALWGNKKLSFFDRLKRQLPGF